MSARCSMPLPNGSRKRSRPVAMQLEHDDVWPAELVEDMKELGLFGRAH